MKKQITVILLIFIFALAGCQKPTQEVPEERTQPDTDAYIENSEWYAEELARLNNELLEALAKLYVLENQPAPAEETPSVADIQTSAAEQIPFTYSIESNGIVIEKYVGSETAVSVPSEIDGKAVVSIGGNAFDGTNVTSVHIADGIKKIGWFAFYNCAGLAEISIPASVTSIGYGAFEYCSSKLMIKCPQDSYAEKYAISYAIRVSR